MGCNGEGRLAGPSQAENRDSNTSEPFAHLPRPRVPEGAARPYPGD
jgi:hypothetical protein